MIPVLPDAALRQDVRARLSKRELFVATGMSSIRRGTGRRCLVCGLPIESPTLEREVEGPGVLGLAHPDCTRSGARNLRPCDNRHPEGGARLGRPAPGSISLEPEGAVSWTRPAVASQRAA
jgi:hypothetical protein